MPDTNPKQKNRKDRISGALIRYTLWIVLLALVGTGTFFGLSEFGSSEDRTLPPASEIPPGWLEYNPRIAGLIAQVNESELYATTYDLQRLGTRRYGTQENRDAAAYTQERLAAIPGLTVRTQGGELNNIIATLPGETNESEAILVGAHYDSTSNNLYRAPGATDNGCGVAIVLELARIMRQYRYNRTLQFAFWNAEELHMQGSRSYAAENPPRSILLYLNYDSSCYDPEGSSVLDVMYNDQAGSVARLFARYNSIYGIHFILKDNDHTCISDHRSFWSRGYPAVMTHSELHGPVHTPEDTVDKASFSYAKKNAQLGLSVLAGIAEIQNQSPDQN